MNQAEGSKKSAEKLLFQIPIQSLLAEMESSEIVSFNINGLSGFQVSLSWNGESRIQHLFDGITGQWKALWRGKGELESRVAWGSLTTMETAPKLVGAGDIRVYGGIPFDRMAEHDAYWREFRHQIFFLPALEWQLNSEPKIVLRCLGSESNRADKSLALKIKLLEIAASASYEVGTGLLISEGIISEPEKPDWLQRVEAAKAKICSGQISKVVLSRAIIMKVPSEITSGQLIEALESNHETSYLFAFESPTGLAFLGRSPERILSWSSTKIQVDAIAGTRTRNQDPSQDEREALKLQGSIKDRSEHRSVTDFVEDVLAGCCEGIQVLDDKSVIKLLHVQHMITRYEARLKTGMSPVDLLKNLHPTPAVAGMPKSAAMSYLRQYENLQRGWFAGSVGWLSSDSGDFAIAIRSGLLHKNILRVYAGAGIVSGSDPESEWFETMAKMRNFTNIFYNPQIGPLIEQNNEDVRS